MIPLSDAVRTVGQLLLHNPTTGAVSRSADNDEVHYLAKDACKFCYIGASFFVAHRLLLDGWYTEELLEACDKVAGRTIDGESWDDASDKQRKRWATKLANYKDSK